LTPRKLALTIFFASVVINAALGIIALFAGDFGEVQGKILMTSLSVSAASVLSLAMFPAKERGLLGVVPTAGIALSVTGFSLLVILVWTEFSEDNLGRTVGSILTFAVAAGYVSLLSLAVVQPKYINVVRFAYLLVAILASFIAGIIWSEPRGDFLLRFMGVLSILLAAATVSIPVLHRLSRAESIALEDESDGYVQVFLEQSPKICLNCGNPEITVDDSGRFECESCGSKFRVETVTNEQGPQDNSSPGEVLDES
jgi:hypothetical protein